MRIAILGAIIGIALAAQPIAAEPVTAPTDIALPGWMAGAWAQSDGDSWADEYWTPPRGGLMIGAARNGKAMVLIGWETTRIERGSDGALTFIAMPNGASPTAFPMVRSGLTEIVFANPAHDYPQRIRYWREGPELLAEISLTDGSKPMRWRYGPLGQ